MLPTTDWRERTEFLDKRTLYVFSLDLALSFPTTEGLLPGDRLRAVAPTKPEPGELGEPFADTYHVLNDDLTTTVDGAVHDTPLARVADLQDWLTLRGMGILDLDGRARLATHDDAFISMSYGGVVQLGWREGDQVALKGINPTGSVQVVASFEVDRPKYRWLAQAQLIGFGEATVDEIGDTKVMTLSIDFYSAL